MVTSPTPLTPASCLFSSTSVTRNNLARINGNGSTDFLWENFNPATGNYLTFGLIFLASAPWVVAWTLGLAILIFFVVIAFTGFDINNFHPFFSPDGVHFTGADRQIDAAEDLPLTDIGV